MRFISVLIPSFFLISSVLAGRRREHHLSHSHNLAKKPTNAASHKLANSNNASNWAGAVWNQPNGTFYSVTGTFSVPNIAGQRVNSSATAVVGIDGSTCRDVMLHAAVSFTVTPSGPSYNAWYEWGFDNTDWFDPPVDISPGDVIRLTVSTPRDETSGLAVVQNLNNNQSSVQHFKSQRALCGQNAVWIVADQARHYNRPLANFGTVTFLEAKAGAKNGQTYLPQNATIMEIVELNDQPLTSVSVNKDMVTIKYLY